MEPTIQNKNYQAPKPKNKGLWTILGLVVVIIVIAIVYFATQRSLDNTGEPTAEETGEVLGAAETVPSNPMIAGLDVLLLESFPYQVNAKVKVDLPDSCSTAKANVAQAGKIYTITVTGSRPKDAVCAQVITSKDLTVSIPVTDAKAGTYTVKAGTYTKTFTFDRDNTIQYSGDK